MDGTNDGRMFAIPRNRRLTWDLLYFHQSVPLCGHDRQMNLQPLADARSACPVRISWPALFLKAYGIVAQSTPELRQTWFRWPVAHIYQHPWSVGILTVQREYKGAPWLFWGRIQQPENQTLLQIQQSIDRLTDGSPAELFRKEIGLARLPTLLRRLCWGWNIHFAKAKRAKRLGTFLLSTLSGKGAEIQVPPSIQTGCLTYGPLGDNATSRVTLAYDHRVMDGDIVATCLKNLEFALLETVRTELLQLRPSDANMLNVA